MSGNQEFNRERFLLRGIAMVILVQLLFFVVAAAACFREHEQQGACTDVANELENSFDTAIGTALALLGGSSLPRGPRP